MHAAPTIAVLMPVYNPGPELTSTLQSIRAQTVPCRLFLVDDGSRKKPDYESLLTGIDHRLIILPQNRGITGALNAGLERILAEGFEFIARLDNGDLMLPSRLKEQAAHLLAHPDISVLGSWVELEDQTSGSTRTINFPEAPETIAAAMWRNMAASHPALMIRSSLFRELGAYSPDYDAAEDYELMRRTLKSGRKIANLNKVLTRKIETTQSISWVKRRTQLRSRLRIQWRYRNLTKISCLRGLAYTLAISAMPSSVTAQIKQLSAGRVSS